AAHVRHHAAARRRLPQLLRCVGAALFHSGPAARRRESRLHVPAHLSCLGRCCIDRGVSGDVVHDRKDPARRPAARRHRKPQAGRSVRCERAAHGHAHLRFRGGAGRLCRRTCRTRHAGFAAHGLEPDHRGICRGGHWRHGLDHGFHSYRSGPGRHRRPDQGLLAGSLEHRRIHHHGHRASAAPRRPFRERKMNRQLALYIVLAILIALLPAAGAYPIFIMKIMCYALFACAFNLLLAYTGLLSFGHAAFLGGAAYATGHSLAVWGFPTLLGLLFGTFVAAMLGLVMGALAIRRSGIYFAMITLAMAQMIFFYFLQAPFTHGEDGLQGIPRGSVFGIDLSNDLNLYYLVWVVFIFGFMVCWRTVNSPFGQVLKALRENEDRAVSLGFDVARFKLLVFVISATLAGLAGATKSLVFVSATLSDATWQMSGLV